MKYIFSIILIFQLFLTYGQNNTWKIVSNESVISYKAKHLLHAWQGINKNVLGITVVDPESKSINRMAVMVYVRDFDSKNSSRDAHSLEVLEALQYPQVKFYSESMKIEGEYIKLLGTLEFHGEKAAIEVVGLAEWTAKKLKLSGTFEVRPTQFKIELPSFMMVPMEDELAFDFNLTFQKQEE